MSRTEKEWLQAGLFWQRLLLLLLIGGWVAAISMGTYTLIVEQPYYSSIELSLLIFGFILGLGLGSAWLLELYQSTNSTNAYLQAEHDPVLWQQIWKQQNNFWQYFTYVWASATFVVWWVVVIAFLVLDAFPKGLLQ
jgi:hypothetical protein